MYVSPWGRTLAEALVLSGPHDLNGFEMIFTDNFSHFIIEEVINNKLKLTNTVLYRNL